MWKRRLLSLPAALVALVLLGGSEGIDPDELACEEAVKKLIDCCPPNSPATALQCYETRGCEGPRPDLAGDQARAIAGESCGEIRDSRACQTQHTPTPPPGPVELPE